MIDILPEQKALPHSEESERAVLGAIFVDPLLLHQLKAMLRPEDFYHERHKLIFEAMLELGEATDLRTLQATLEQRGDFEAVGGLAYLSGLDLDLPDINRADLYAGIVRDRAARRRLMQACAEGIRSCLDGGLGAQTAASNLLTACNLVIEQVSDGNGFASMADAVEATVTELEDDENQELDGLTTGVADLDALIGAMERQTLWGIGARPGVGKTSFALQVAAQGALDKQKHVGFVTLEMTKRELSIRLLAQRTGVDSKRIKHKRFSVPEHTRILKARQHIRFRDTLHIDESSNDIDTIEARARQLAARVQLYALVVDYLQLVQVKGRRFDKDHQRVGHVADRLARLSKTLGILVIACSQFSRDYAKANRLPTIADLREGGEEPMHGALLLHRPPTGNPGEGDHEVLSPVGKIVVGKNRSGEVGVVDTYFDGPCQTFRALDTHHQEPWMNRKDAYQ